MFRWIFFFLFLYFLPLSAILAQKDDFIPFSKYTQKEGLSSYYITKILQDQFGFLWVSTQDGVNCFDGRKFQVFQKEKESQHRIFGNNVTDMIEDSSRNIIWVSTSQGGIAA